MDVVARLGHVAAHARDVRRRARDHRGRRLLGRDAAEHVGRAGCAARRVRRVRDRRCARRRRGSRGTPSAGSSSAIAAARRPLGVRRRVRELRPRREPRLASRAATSRAWLYLWTWFPVLGADRDACRCCSRTAACPGPVAARALGDGSRSSRVVALCGWSSPAPMSDPGEPLWPDNPVGIGFLDPVYDVLEAVSTLVLAVFLVLSAGVVDRALPPLARRRAAAAQVDDLRRRRVARLDPALGCSRTRRPQRRPVRADDRGAAGRDGGRDVQVPALRDRPRDLADARLRRR